MHHRETKVSPWARKKSAQPIHSSASIIFPYQTINPQQLSVPIIHMTKDMCLVCKM